MFVLWVVGPTSVMRLSEAFYPLLTLGLAVGAVLGSLIAERVQHRLGEIPTMLGCLFASTLLLLIPVLWPNPWATAAAFALIGVTNTMGNVIAQSLRQRLVPGDMLGRIGGASRTLSFGLMPLGALAGGVLAQAAGLAATFHAAVALSLLACGFLTWSLRRHPLTGQ